MPVAINLLNDPTFTYHERIEFLVHPGEGPVAQRARQIPPSARFNQATFEGKDIIMSLTLRTFLRLIDEEHVINSFEVALEVATKGSKVCETHLDVDLKDGQAVVLKRKLDTLNEVRKLIIDSRAAIRLLGIESESYAWNEDPVQIGTNFLANETRGWDALAREDVKALHHAITEAIRVETMHPTIA